MTSCIFLPRPSEKAVNDLIYLGLDVVPFIDCKIPGFLLSGFTDLLQLEAQLPEITEFSLTRNQDSSEFDDILWYDILPTEELQTLRLQKLCEGILSQKDPLAKPDTDALKEARKKFLSTTHFFANKLSDLSEGKFDVAVAERMREEFQLILNHPQITNVALISNPARIRISTTELLCKDSLSGVVHSIGVFDITVQLKVQKEYEFHDDFTSHLETIHWDNKTKRIHYDGHDWEHPHIPQGGNPCLGNMSGVFEPLIKNGEYFAAIEMAIRFIESANVRDQWGANLCRWPKIAK